MIQCVLVAKDKPSIKKWPKIDLAVDFLPLTKEHTRRSRHLLRHQYGINRLKKSIGTKRRAGVTRALLLIILVETYVVPFFFYGAVIL